MFGEFKAAYTPYTCKYRMLDNGIDLYIYKTMYLSNQTNYQPTDRPKNNLRVICNFYRNQIAGHSRW